VVTDNTERSADKCQSAWNGCGVTLGAVILLTAAAGWYPIKCPAGNFTL
jgi:hypothetical protein